jgi:hypothetical protein
MDAEQRIQFQRLPKPSDSEVAWVMDRIARRIIRLLEQRGLGTQADPDEADPLLRDQPLLAELEFMAKRASNGMKEVYIRSEPANADFRKRPLMPPIGHARCETSSRSGIAADARPPTFGRISASSVNNGDGPVVSYSAEAISSLGIIFSAVKIPESKEYRISNREFRMMMFEFPYRSTTLSGCCWLQGPIPFLATRIVIQRAE